MGNVNVANTTRQESDNEYIKTMKDYMENKYSVSFDIVESILPASGLNTGMEVNVLVLRDSDGCITNVRAKYGTPYNFYDDYVQVKTAAKILSGLKTVNEPGDSLNLYVTSQNRSIDSIDTSPASITSVTIVAKIPEEPNDANLKHLYEIYKEVCMEGYNKVYFLVGFVRDSSDFDAAVDNYSLYGKSKWSDYSGDFYSYLRTTSVELSFEEFVNSIEK